MTTSTPVKRRITFDDADSENIDPSAFLSHKKSKTTDGNLIVKPGKTSQFVLTNAIRSSVSASRPILTPKRLETSRSTLTNKPKVVQPASAPAATGRSPKSKRIGILSRRRVSSSPFTRVDPPSFGSSNGLPFSIDAALSGSVSTYNPNQPPNPHLLAKSSRKAQQKKWMFDIHEDTPEQESSNLLQHSTCTLDISDDEGRPKDDRGKENIPPLDYVVSANANRSISRNDMMTDEPRTPLGDLEASQYYAEGCDESSAVIIPDEKVYEETSATLEVNVITSKADITEITIPCQPSADVDSQSDGQWKDLMAELECNKKSNATFALATAAKEGSNEAEIEIWESESAKAEDESASKGITSNILQTIMPETYTCGAFGDENTGESDST